MPLDPKYNKKPDDPLFVDCIETPLQRNHMPYYLREAWRSIYGKYPTSNTLAILYAQTVLETGGSELRNNNWGNIKKRPGLKYTSYKAGEYFNNKHYIFWPYNPQTFFASWDTPIEGAAGYINFLANRTRYKKAWDALIQGNPQKYCIELKSGGYFTAPLSHYMKVVLRLFEEFKKNEQQLLEWKPEVVKEPPESEIEVILVEPEPISDPNPEPVVELEPVPDPELLPELPIEETNEIVDLVPIKDDKEKANAIAKFFFTIWSYILRVIEYFKPNKK